MSNGPKKLSALPVATNVAGADRLMILQSPASSPVTKTVALSTLIRGPYASDGAAASAGIIVGQPYYDNSGSVKVRLS